MRHSLSTTAGIVSGVVALLGPVWLQGQAATPGQVRAAGRSAVLMSRSNPKPEVGQGTSVVGSIWSSDDVGIPNVVVRLRDLVAGTVAAATRTGETGAFSFRQLGEGTYVIEVAATDDGSPIAFGDVFTIGRDETVAVFVKLPRPLGWPSTLAALIGPQQGAASAAGAAGNSVGSAVIGSDLAGVFGTAAASVVSSAASAGIVSFGGGRAASNEDQPQ